MMQGVIEAQSCEELFDNIVPFKELNDLMKKCSVNANKFVREALQNLLESILKAC